MGDFALLHESAFPPWRASCQGAHDCDAICALLVTTWTSLCSHCLVTLGGDSVPPGVPSSPLYVVATALPACPQLSTERTVLIQIQILSLLAEVFAQVTLPL